MTVMDQFRSLNGDSNCAELHIGNKKPIVTYAGDKDLFLSLESTLVNSLPQEATEWRRSYGRVTKSITVSATFVPFNKEILPKEGNGHLIDQPVFHTYWTQCSDVDTYKASVREDIDLWMRVLLQYNLADWMIVLVETFDYRKSNKLLSRTTVLDKIRSDFGAKNAERCLGVINPLRLESRSARSWRGLIVNFRLLLLAAYDRTVLRFEDTIREKREKRNQPGWIFTKYFLLQEELAFVLEMLGVYEEALVQYDELDALFTQFIVNSNLGDSPAWLEQYRSPLDSWAGLCLSDNINTKERSRIQKNTASLLQIRNYLFSRQCAMLLKAKKPWEVAERTLPFLHNCIRELRLLEVQTSKGAIAAWVFLSALEVLGTCDAYKDTSLVQQYSLYTAGLWAYAWEKLGELGELCGLMPKDNTSSEQLHRVVEISSGIEESSSKPLETLKTALSSKEAFKKQYLELCELAMGTYKHIGRVRCARSIGHDLANFHRAASDPATAILHLQNALHSYEQDGWKNLAANIRLQLAQCYKQTNDLHRYVKMCASIASSVELDMVTRLQHYEDMVKLLDTVQADPLWTGLVADCMTISEIQMDVDKGNTTVTAIVTVLCNLPKPTYCSSVSLSVVQSKNEHKSQISKHRVADCTKKKTIEDITLLNPLFQRLSVVTRLDYQQDRSIAGANTEIKEKPCLRRQDSHGRYRKISSVAKTDFTKSLNASKVKLEPGLNEFYLVSKEFTPGTYRLCQLSVVLLGKLDLLSVQLPYKVYFEVSESLPSLAVTSPHGDLLAGIHQSVFLDISTNGFHIPQGSKIEVRASSGLSLQVEGSDEPLVESCSIPVEETPTNSFVKIPISILAQLPSLKENAVIDHQISVKPSWTSEEKQLELKMQPLFISVLKMYTGKQTKFLHVTVTGLTSQALAVRSPTMTILSPPGASLIPANPPDQSVIIGDDRKVGFMWKLDAEKAEEGSLLKTEFTILYEPVVDGDSLATHMYKCVYDIGNFKTLYLVDLKIEPGRGSEFCRVSTVCQLVIKVTRVSETSDTTLMYEVLKEQNMWAVCGSAAGILSLDSSKETSITLDVMPLINGHLPLPNVKLSKYIPAKHSNNPRSADNQPRLESFSTGQVYNMNKGTQVHVIAGAAP